jgi:transcriptional regulator with XRE-family HTH domain
MTAAFDHERLVEALERAREQRGMSWRQVAAEADLDPSTVARIVRGGTPDLPRFAALIDWLGLPADFFFPRGVDLLDGADAVDVVVRGPEGAVFYLEIKSHTQMKPGALQNLQRVAQAAVDMYEADR